MHNKSQFVAEIAVALGGFVAEKNVFGEMSTGASSDLKESTKLARALVTQYGMSEELGPQTFGESHELVFLGKEIASEKNYSEAVASKIDEEIKKIIDRAHAIARKVIGSRRKVLDEIVKALLEKETLEKDEFEKIIKGFNLKPLAI